MIPLLLITFYVLVEYVVNPYFAIDTSLIPPMVFNFGSNQIVIGSDFYDFVLFTLIPLLMFATWIFLPDYLKKLEERGKNENA